MTKKENPLATQPMAFLKEEIARQRKGIAIYKKAISAAEYNIGVLEKEVAKRRRKARRKK